MAGVGSGGGGKGKVYIRKIRLLNIGGGGVGGGYRSLYDIRTRLCIINWINANEQTRLDPYR